jgi:hypothetical protein
MNDLIEALQILSKYGNPNYPTHCEHDMLHVCINPCLVTDEDKQKLDELGFFPGEYEDFCSFKFGSA